MTWVETLIVVSVAGAIGAFAQRRRRAGTFIMLLSFFTLGLGAHGEVLLDTARRQHSAAISDSARTSGQSGSTTTRGGMTALMAAAPIAASEINEARAW